MEKLDMKLSLAILVFYLALTSGLAGVITSLAERCNVSLPSVLCISKYASVMPYHFSRPSSYNSTDNPFGSTSIPNDTSFAQINTADFLVFDRKRGLDLLRCSPAMNSSLP